MKNYDKTLWENNKSIVDADKLNNIEDQIQILTLTTARNNDRLQVLEDTQIMKANIRHTHDELHGNLVILERKFNSLIEDLNQEFGKYFDNVELEGTTLHFYSNEELKKSIELPTIASNEAIAICGEAICGEVLVSQGLEKTSKSYNPTIWEDGVTPINAENLNNIENKIVELVSTVDNILANGGSVDSNIHIGNTEPINKNDLWIDNSDEEPESTLDESVIEAFASVLREHSDQIRELFYLSDAYLDDGDFTDTEESEYILEGGIF